MLGPDRVVWTQWHAACSLEAGCDPSDFGPTLSMRDLSGGPATTLIEDRWGATALAGDQDEVFLLLSGTDETTSFIARFRPGISTAPEPFTTPQARISAPVVDATYVYWTTPGAPGESQVYRARRDGTGDDALVIHTGTFVPMFESGGYLWSGVDRMPAAGGSVEHLTMIDGTYPTTAAGGIVATKSLDAAGTYYSLGILDATDSYRVIFPSIFQPYRPSSLVFDSNELLWACQPGLCRGHLDDPTFTPDPRNPQIGVFAVTHDAILYNFTRRGYDIIAR